VHYSGAARPQSYFLYGEDRGKPEKCADGPLSEAVCFTQIKKAASFEAAFFICVKPELT